MDAQTAKIGFIGFGNMAKAMAEGLVSYAGFDPARIYACAKHFNKLEAKCTKLGVNPLKSAAEVVQASDIVVIAVKPHIVKSVLDEIKPALEKHGNTKAIVSVAVGLLYDFYNSELGRCAHHISTIPNVAISVGSGVIACENKHTLTDDMWRTFTEIFGSVALIEQVDGKQLNCASALAGSGPAFAAMFMEAMADGGVKGGLRRECAYKLAAQTMLGTAKLCLDAKKHPAVIKDEVTSPAGTTIRGVSALENAGMRAAVMNAIDATLS